MFRSAARPTGLRSFTFTSEQALGTLGCTIAIASGSFGLYMNLYGPSEPHVNGGQYLAIFAQGNTRTQGPKTPLPAGAADQPDAPGIDPLATGSIAPVGAAGREEAGPKVAVKTGIVKPSLLKDFRLREAFGDTALVEDHDRLRIVQVGTVLAGAGRVLSIEQRDGQWTVVTSEGVIAGRAASDK